MNKRGMKTIASFKNDTFTKIRIYAGRFDPIGSKYWILDMDEEYNWMLVGEPCTDYLYIMSRKWNLDDNIVEKLLDYAKTMDYKIDDLIITP